jgi:hypothetical protein
MTNDDTIVSSPAVFENASQPPPVGRREVLPGLADWDWSDCISPRFVSEPDDSDEARLEFMRGAEAMGLVGRKKSILPQQYLLADVLNSNQRFTGVLMPRRSTKTSTILAWLIGRCLSREDYLCAYGHMASQKKARDRFLKDVVPILERVYPDAQTRPFKIVRANGQERLVFDNGSILQFLGPNEDDYRSDAYDVIVLDESGEAEPATGEDVLAAALPTQDTRPGAMLVYAGTAAKYRVGNLLWDELVSGRSGAPRHAILDFSAEDMDLEEFTGMGWDQVAPLILESHPGVGNLTTLESVEDNFTNLSREKFAREYLGIFGTVGSKTGFLNLAAWTAGAQTGKKPTPPEHFRMALAVNLISTSSAIVAAWRNDKGQACLFVMDHGKGSTWVGGRARSKALKYKTPIVYDIGVAAVTAEVDKLKRTSPKPQLLPQKWPDVSTAASLLRNEIDAGNVIHWNQDPLTTAVTRAKKRGTPDSKRWAFGSIDRDDDDITPLEAAAMALRAYDDSKPKTPYKGHLQT